MSEPAPSASHGSGIQLTPKAITALVIGAAAFIFIFSNTEPIALHFLWFEFRAPGWVMLLGLFAGGLSVGFYLGRNRYRQ